MKFIRMVVSIFVFSFYSCDNEYSGIKIIFSEEKELHAAKISPDEIIMPTFMTGKNDNLMIATVNVDTSLYIYKVLKGEFDEQKINMNDFPHNIHYYTNMVAGENYFYVLCQGRSDADYDTGVDTIEMYDYNGAPIRRYKFDISPTLFSVDEKNQMIYGYNPNYQDYLLKYSMEME
jgi:hypothetical protein